MDALWHDIETFKLDAVGERFAAAQAAVSRLDERARLSSRREAWMRRVLFSQACACQGFEGDLVYLEDLVLLDGDAFSGAPSMALSSALDVLKTWRAAEAGDAARALNAPRPGLVAAPPLAESGEGPDAFAPAGIDAHLLAWRRVGSRTREWPALIAAAMSWDAWLRLLPESRSSWRATLLAALTLRTRGLTPNLLLPLDVGARIAKYRRDAGQDFTARMAGFLEWAEAAAGEGQKAFDSLTLAENLLRHTVRGGRSNSRMPQLMELLLERPFVSVALASKALRVSRQAAHTLLKRIGAPVHRLTDRKRCNAWSIMG